MTERTGTPLNDALNRPREKLGMDWRLLAAFAALSALVAIFASLILGIGLLALAVLVARTVLRNDPQLLRLWALAFLQRAYYDPGKAGRA